MDLVTWVMEKAETLNKCLASVLTEKCSNHCSVCTNQRQELGENEEQPTAEDQV